MYKHLSDCDVYLSSGFFYCDFNNDRCKEGAIFVTCKNNQHSWPADAFVMRLLRTRVVSYEDETKRDLLTVLCKIT